MTLRIAVLHRSLDSWTIQERRQVVCTIRLLLASHDVKAHTLHTQEYTQHTVLHTVYNTHACRQTDRHTRRVGDNSGSTVNQCFVEWN